MTSLDFWVSRGLVLLLALPVLACSSDDGQLPIVTPERPKDAAARDTRRGSTSTPTTGAEPSNTVEPTSAVDSGPGPIVDAGGTSDTLAAETAPGAGAEAGTEAGPVVGPGMEATWSHTACDKKALMFPKIDRNNGVFPIGSCPPPEGLNRACGGNSKIKVMKATAQTYETGYVHPPEYAIDEYIMTRWSSNTMATSWIELDLGTEQTFKRLYLAWEIAHGTDYDIVTSNDGMTWAPLKQVRGGDGYQDILDVEGKARYVRMNGIRRGNIGMGPYGYSLFDFTICGERP